MTWEKHSALQLFVCRRFHLCTLCELPKKQQHQPTSTAQVPKHVPEPRKRKHHGRRHWMWPMRRLRGTNWAAFAEGAVLGATTVLIGWRLVKAVDVIVRDMPYESALFWKTLGGDFLAIGSIPGLIAGVGFCWFVVRWLARA